MFIKTFEQYSKDLSILDDFFDNSQTIITEESKSSIKKMVGEISTDLKINSKFVATFGLSIDGLYPIVQSLMENMKLSSVDLTPRVITMLVLASLSVIVLEEKSKKFKPSPEDEDEIRTGAKSLLTELKLSGVGNGIVKKLVEAIKSIKNIASIIFKNIPKAVESMVDMFAYTSLMIPILNGIKYIVGEYDLTIDTLIQNLAGIGMGIFTIIAKSGVKEVLRRLGFSKKQEDDIIKDMKDDVEVEVDEEIPNIEDGRAKI